MIPLLISAFVLATPLVLASMGGYFSERSGVVNIALEGKMIAATIVGAAAGVASHNPWIGLMAGVLAAVVMSLVHFCLTQWLPVDHVVSGMAVNALAMGGANVIDRLGGVSQGKEVPNFPVNAYLVVGLLVVLGTWYLVRQTKFGLQLVACGADPEKARESSISVAKVRFVAQLLTGLCCGLAGMMMISNAGYYSDGMTAGRGYIALAALILGSWRPIPTLIASVLFGFFQALQIQLQGTKLGGFELPREIWLCLPYLVAVIALAGFLGRSVAPAGLGRRTRVDS